MEAKFIADGWENTGQFFNRSPIFEKGDERVYVDSLDGSIKKYTIEPPHP
jgi:hypothetical protein